MSINNSKYIRDMPEYTSQSNFDITKLFDYSGKVKTAKEITLEEFVEEFDYDTSLTKKQIFEKFGLKEKLVLISSFLWSFVSIFLSQYFPV